MTDRELLEAAAKAAGFGAPESGAVCWTESEYPPRSGKHGALWNYVGYLDTAQLWNPLTDDGDALRLAVKLGIAVSCRNGNAQATYPLADGRFFAPCDEPAGEDPWAATRRVIVRAAAEIGNAR
jgi:hypothetical protein